MEVISIIYGILMTWYAIDTKIELENVKDIPPRVVNKVVIKEVKVPVAMECPKPKDITPPDLAINNLTYSDYNNFAKISESYAISLKQCMGYAEQQKIILDGYRADIIK